MIHLDHADGHATVAERSDAVQRRTGDPAQPVVTTSYRESKRARDLAEGDAVAKNFRGYGSLIMRVVALFVARGVEGDVITVYAHLVGANESTVETYNPDDKVVLHPSTRVGTWL